MIVEFVLNYSSFVYQYKIESHILSDSINDPMEKVEIFNHIIQKLFINPLRLLPPSAPPSLEWARSLARVRNVH